MSTNGHCSNCTFFEEKASETGLCRFNPPVTQPARDERGLWPVVQQDDWCGHFEKEAA